MKQQRFKLYKLDIKYIRNLARHDKNILSVSPQISKENRPFLGIILILDTHKYCIPLSSPKPKHHNMRNRADFTKIYDGNKIIGVLNFNNMIPVTDSVISEINLKILPNDTPQTKYYKKLLQKELDWCQKHETDIVNKANLLYNKFSSNSLFSARCCNFLLLEQLSQNYEDK